MKRFFNIFVAVICTCVFSLGSRLAMAESELCEHRELEDVYKVSLKDDGSKQYKALVSGLREHGVTDVQTSGIYEAFLSCLERFSALHPTFKLSSKGIVGQDLLLAFGEKSASLKLSKLNKLHKNIKSAEKDLGLKSGFEHDAFWFLWVEAALAATKDRFNYYIYADQMEFEKFMSGGRSFAVGFSPEYKNKTLVVKAVTDAALTREGLKPGVEIIEISSEKVEENNRYSWWLQQTPFSYQVSFKQNGVLKTVQAKSIPFATKEFVSKFWGDIAYIRFNSFTGRTSVEMSRFMRRISEKAKAVLIDVRFNGGGAINPAVPDYFLKPSDEIMAYRYLEEEVEHVPGSLAYTDLPVVILQNRYSASMSEILVAAVKAQNRGTIVGEKSFGKGVGQTMFPVGKEGIVALVETEFFFPGGEVSWHEKGIEPDVAIQVGEDEMSRLLGHLYSSEIDLEKMASFDKALRRAKDILSTEISGN